MKYGDFTSLAQNYNKFRPSYSNKIPNILTSYFKSKPKYADIASGTGIFSKLCFSNGLKPNYIIEPNQEMIGYAKLNFKNVPKVKFIKNYAEKLTLKNNSLNLITVASAFHWFNFNLAIKEFNRVLKDKGVVCLCWNTREIKKQDFVFEFEEKLKKLKNGNLIRKSSGNSIDKDKLIERLMKTNMFSHVDYFEIFHTEKFSKSRYIGAWKSVNDIRVNLGEKKFNSFIQYLDDKISNKQIINTNYKNKIWIACKK